jgi:hypothetical protein
MKKARRFLPAVFLAVLLPGAKPALADSIITIQDATDSLSVSVSGDSPNPVVNKSCASTGTFEECSFSITPPTGYRIASGSLGSSFNTYQLIAESSAVNSPVSDKIKGCFLDASGSCSTTVTANDFFIDFLSDGANENTFGTCQFQSCTATETGASQQYGFLVWTPIAGGPASGQPNVIDTFNFISDVETAVPEPASMALLGTGLLFAVRHLTRRRKNNR